MVVEVVDENANLLIGCINRRGYAFVIKHYILWFGKSKMRVENNI